MSKVSVFHLWTDDAIRDGMVSGHISEWSGLQELERRHPSEPHTPTPKEVFA